MLGVSARWSQSWIATGRSFFTYATSEFVVPRSIPIGRGAAFGSKISKRTSRVCAGEGSSWGSCVAMDGLLFDGVDLLEEAPVEAELAELSDVARHAIPDE